MTNPWLQIPASDYEGHMGSPRVAQLTLLAQTFKEALNKYESKSIALLGCATGNGLEYINNNAPKRITAIDINPDRLKEVQSQGAGAYIRKPFLLENIGLAVKEELEK